MPESDQTTVIVLLGICLCLGLLTVVLVLGISARLAALERRKGSRAVAPETTVEAPSVADSSVGGAFELFLSEDPSRRDLTKAEQFAAYREWRHEKGMNWVAS